MKYILLSMLSLCLCGLFNVNCGLLEYLLKRPSDEVLNKIALILAVEHDGRTYFANNQFVKVHMNALYKQFLFVCPEETDEDKNLNISSNTKNALFVKKTHQNIHNGSKDDIVNHTCASAVKPSIIKKGPLDTNSPVDVYFVGYEVYLTDDVPMDDYQEIVGFESAQFKWFNVYTIMFNHDTRSVVSVFSRSLTSLANKNKNMQPALETVFDYSLGMEKFFKDIDVSTIFAKDHHNKVYYKEVYREVDELEERLLVPVHLAHLKSFGSPLLRRAGMTLVNTAPMWKTVHQHAWRTVEMNLDLLAQGVKAISVITGVYGALKYSDFPYYVATDNTVEVPEAFYKIISYSPNNADKYNMVIVTNNSPFVKNYRTNENGTNENGTNENRTDENRTIEKICKQNECKFFGWDHVQQDSPHLGRTTCCQLTHEVLTELKLPQFSSLVDKTLDLNKVRHWQNEELTLNIKAYIRNQIRGDHKNKLSDDELYKNEELNINPEDEEITYSHLLKKLHENFVSPYFK